MEIKFGKWVFRIKKAELSLASFVAGIVSWSCNQSILWLVLHYFLGLFYVVYWMIFGDCTWHDVFEYYKNLIK